MTASRDKGTRFETPVVEWLKTHGFPYAHRNPPAGSKDIGDVGGIPGIVLELKNCKRTELAQWISEASAEAANADASLYAVVHKRRGKTDPAEQYVTMPLWVFAKLAR